MFYNWRIKSSKKFPRNHAVPGLFFRNCSGEERAYWGKIPEKCLKLSVMMSNSITDDLSYVFIFVNSTPIKMSVASWIMNKIQKWYHSMCLKSNENKIDEHIILVSPLFIKTLKGNVHQSISVHWVFRSSINLIYKSHVFPWLKRNIVTICWLCKIAFLCHVILMMQITNLL